jgi:hypothetical protein
MYLCTTLIISVFKSYENDLFPCNNKSILMSTLLFWGIIVCMVSNKTNLNLLYLGQINNIYMVEPTRRGMQVLTHLVFYTIM